MDVFPSSLRTPTLLEGPRSGSGLDRANQTGKSDRPPLFYTEKPFMPSRCQIPDARCRPSLHCGCSAEAFSRSSYFKDPVYSSCLGEGIGGFSARGAYETIWSDQTLPSQTCFSLH